MKIKLNTVPLKDALNIAIINSNVNKFYTKSLLAQVTLDGDSLRINHAANMILSEVKLKGNGDNSTATIIVDSLLFKSLISTIKSSTIDIEFTATSLIIKSGKSAFTLPAFSDAEDMSLPAPSVVSDDDLENSHIVHIDEWKSIKDHQLYAKAASTNLPIYTYAYLGSDGTIIVGDYINSLFTMSMIAPIGNEPCLLTDTIINLFTAFPENSVIIKNDSCYQLIYNSDSFSAVAEFTPAYESDDIGNYNSEIIIGIMTCNSNRAISVDASNILEVINQASLLSTEKDPSIIFTASGNSIKLRDKHVESTILGEGNANGEYSITLSLNRFKTVLQKCPTSELNIAPTEQEDSIVGININSGNVDIVIAGVE